MRANSRYIEIARRSLKENQPALHDRLKADGQLETFLQGRAQAASDQVADVHLRNFRSGVPAGTSLAEAQDEAIRDHLLFLPKEEQQSDRNGYHDQVDTPPAASAMPPTADSKAADPSPDFAPGELKAWADRFAEAFVKNLNSNVVRQQREKK